jgi:Protein of unknown function (DUF3987)
MLDLNNAPEQEAPAAQQPRYDRGKILASLQASATQWVPEIFPAGKVERNGQGSVWRVADIAGRAPRNKGSCVIRLDGNDAGGYHEYGGIDGGGDAVATIADHYRLGGLAVLEKAAEIAERHGRLINSTRPKKQRHRSPEENIPAAQLELSRSVPAPGTLVETYLKTRGLDLPETDDIRFGPECTYYNDTGAAWSLPALIAVVRKPDGTPTGGIHRIYLTEDGSRHIDKKMLGPCNGGVVMLGKPDGAGEIGFAEGVESALAATQLTGIPTWSTLTAGGMREIADILTREMLPNISRLVAFADRGSDGIDAGTKLRNAAITVGINGELWLPTGDDDFADDLAKGLPLSEPEPAPPKRTAKTTERDTDGAHSPWPEPLSDAAYHGITGEFVRAILPHTEADPAALLFQFLAFTGNVFGDTAWVTIERTKHYANLFVVVVGATAKSRKGTAEGWVRDLLRMAAPAWDRNCIASGLSTGEGLIARVRDPEYGKDKKGIDELIHPGVADKRLLIVESEFSRPLHVMERGGNSTLSAVLRDAWDHKPLSILTRNDPVKAHGASISVVAHITCEELRRDLTDISTANGFGNRFLWTVARRSKALPFGGNVSEGAFEELANRLQASLEQPSVGPIRFDEIARHKWNDVYPNLTEDHPGLLGALTARTEAQVVRVAIIYALLDHQHLIGKAHLDAALEVVRYSNDSVRHIFGDTTGNHIADTILKALRTCPEGMSRWDIANSLFSRNVKSNDIAAALGELLGDGKIKKLRRDDTGGRPAEIWFAV